MRIDVLTIFPEYLAPLQLSLIGKARRDGLLDLRVRDLREYTHDRHRTVDDTPYGGGAGMVMRPEPWALALEAVTRDAGGSGTRPVLIVPGPAGRPFTQALAAELARQPWLAFACGRYEGIDERVYDFAATDLGLRVEILSLGDYVLNGGEVAVLAMVEAIARLVPGVVGNADSLVEESHTGGLLEYPVYTKPASWRGRDVPAQLLSGDHGAIAAWRHEQRLVRTAARRPDLLAASALLTGDAPLPITVAIPADWAELFVLQRACRPSRDRVNDDVDIAPPVDTPDELRATLGPGSHWRTWVVRDSASRLVASVRGRFVAAEGDARSGTWQVDRLLVAPDLSGRGLGRALLEHALRQADPRATRAWLITCAASARSQRMFRRVGFRMRGGAPTYPGRVEMTTRLPAGR